ncbi:transcriptional regulator [Aquibium oceanicum]|uniref:Transcriptional regulator n=2 Tax=Aquibium oceanicum TaxID=1670800 RepID=A0A1L3SVP7_9HYPH|nr:transcriptional regulator [Aquibium oceanicum]
MTNRKPYADSRAAKYIDRRVLELSARKTQNHIAMEAGFKTPNVLSMLKTGTSKVPLDRVPALAKALECDPRHLCMLALEQLGGSMTISAIDEIFGTIVTENEVVWLEELRDASDGADPRLTQRARAALRAIFGK